MACIICGGSKEEHFKEGKAITRHAYSEREGELITHEEKAKQQQKTQLGGMPLASMVNAQPNSVGRLVEVLLDSGVIRTEDALYIAAMGSKPNPPSGFADPARHPFYQPTPGAGY